MPLSSIIEQPIENEKEKKKPAGIIIVGAGGKLEYSNQYPLPPDIDNQEIPNVIIEDNSKHQSRNQSTNNLYDKNINLKTNDYTIYETKKSTNKTIKVRSTKKTLKSFIAAIKNK